VNTCSDVGGTLGMERPSRLSSNSSRIVEMDSPVEDDKAEDARDNAGVAVGVGECERALALASISDTAER